LRTTQLIKLHDGRGFDHGLLKQSWTRADLFPDWVGIRSAGITNRPIIITIRPRILVTAYNQELNMDYKCSKPDVDTVMHSEMDRVGSCQ